MLWESPIMCMTILPFSGISNANASIMGPIMALVAASSSGESLNFSSISFIMASASAAQ